MAAGNNKALPGYRLGLGTTTAFLGLIVLLPLAAGAAKAFELSPSEFLAAVWTPRTIAAYKLTLWTSVAAASINVVLGLIVAWTLVRYEFPGRKLLDALVDIPFALPTAVAGLVYANLYVSDGPVGRLLLPVTGEIAYTPAGIVLVLIFTGFPFVVRSVQPVLEDLDAEMEEAAAILGATPLQSFLRVILPNLIAPTLTGFTLALARSVGEYGSVIFISTNRPYEMEIAPVLIVARLEEYAYREAAAVAVVLLAVSFVLLVAINLLERRSRRHG